MEQHNTNEMIAAARRLINAGEYAKAYKILETLFNRRAEGETDEQRALIMSFYGLVLARHLKQWNEGRDICEKAMGMQFYLAETYINLARLYLDRPLPPYKRKAEKLLTDALKIDGTNRAAHAELERLHGDRFRAISFLSPDNFLNQLLAKIFGKA
jgi:hypothetical protein